LVAKSKILSNGPIETCLQFGVNGIDLKYHGFSNFRAYCHVREFVNRKFVERGMALKEIPRPRRPYSGPSTPDGTIPEVTNKGRADVIFTYWGPVLSSPCTVPGSD
jgi:hypothetical protein